MFISIGGHIEVMATTKFYHYNIWMEDEGGTRLDPQKVLNTDVFADGLSRIPGGGNTKSYHVRFQFIRNGQYHGMLTRTKDESGYLRLNQRFEMGLLSDETQDEGETGDIDTDQVNFAITFDGLRLNLLVEVGFQTPGINVIKRYLRENVNDTVDSIKHETAIPDLNEDEIQRLLNSELKKIEVSFKKHPEVHEDLEAEETMKQIIPDDYRVKFEVSIEQGEGTEEKRVDEYLEGFFSVFNPDHDTVEETIYQIDFPRIMHTFRIEGMEGEQEIEENLAEVINKAEIDTSQYDLFDRDLGERLCEEIRDRDQ